MSQVYTINIDKLDMFTVSSRFKNNTVHPPNISIIFNSILSLSAILLSVFIWFWNFSDSVIFFSFSFREQPFNLKVGGYGFFLKKIFWFPATEKKYSDFGGGKKKFDSEFLSYNLMLNSWKKIRALRDKKNILTLELSEKTFLN